MSQLGAYQSRFNTRQDRFRRAVILKLFTSVIMDTPVLTGRLRGNWQLTTNGPASTAPELIDKAGATASRIATEVQSQVKPGDGSVFLTNSMPYCNRIEYEGWSHTKAPEGMVRKNIVRIANLIRSRARL